MKRDARPADREADRVASLLGLVSSRGGLALDLGARDGHIAKRIAPWFDRVVALDLTAPQVDAPGVMAVAANGAALPFADGVFDTVLCAEVLEHVAPKETLRRLCREICRVAAREVIIGVPDRQDLRVGRTTCTHCGRHNPPWGHVNAFNERSLLTLFKTLTPVAVVRVGQSRETTNALSSALLDFAGNPWGTYHQSELCIACGRPVGSAGDRSLAQRVASKVAHAANATQRRFCRPNGRWLHVRFLKGPPNAEGGASRAGVQNLPGP
jgi:ubiquinone/menaquinone biosynthesis C-methylase UbiE